MIPCQRDSLKKKRYNTDLEITNNSNEKEFLQTICQAQTDPMEGKKKTNKEIKLKGQRSTKDS